MASLSTTSHASSTLLSKPKRVARPSRITFSNIPSKPCKISMTTLSTARPKTAISPKTLEKESNSNKAAVPYEKLESWMRDSVGEIVNNLREAPLLLRVYDDDDRKLVVSTQKAEQEDWDVIKGKWENKECPMPEGVILVEELDQECESGITKAWGVVVQGRGNSYGPVCYLLKTSYVVSGLGLGCTHFCLTKVQDFRETALSQLKNCWLLQAQ